VTINIRGTGGAGKSHLVRLVMERYAEKIPSYIEGRKRPISYVCTRPNGRSLFVPGHYETPTGGCDTLKTVNDVYDRVRQGATDGHDVLFEGIMVGDDVTRCVALSEIEKVLVIALNTSLEECLASIQSRRDTRGDDRPLSPRRTTDRHHLLRRGGVPRLKDGGVDVRWLSRSEALAVCLQELGF
jgi:hypothetical protein